MALPYSQRAAITAEVLRLKGGLCVLQLGGCTTIATEPDHIVPDSEGGGHGLDNLRPSCAHCNRKRKTTPLVTAPAHSRSWFL